MSQYMILFYKRKADTISTAKYYREFETFKELVNWCNAVKNECNYYRFSHQAISKEEYLKHI